MKTYFSKFNHSIFLIGLALLFISCGKEAGKGIFNPIPSENPIIFTEKEQSKTIWVGNLALIYPENPKTDSYEADENNMIVSNDWIKITSYKSEDSSRKCLIINIKENTSTQARTYNMPMSGKPGEAILHITQLGK